MRLFNVVEISDNGEFVSIITQTGTVVHLPMNQRHSITIADESTTSAYIVEIEIGRG
jgi:hypothetical protein